MKKALLVTRVSGFVPQFEMNNVRLLQEKGYEVHYAANFDTVVYGSDNSRLEGTGIVCHHIPFCRSPFSRQVTQSYRALKELMQQESFDLIHCHMPMTGVVTRMAAQSLRKSTGKPVPVLYTAHGFHFCKGAPLQNWIYYIPERFLSRYTDVLITMNDEDYERAQTFPIRGQAKKISGAGIDLTGRPCRDFSNTTNTPFQLISVGELNANKNHVAVLKALTKFDEKEIHYTIYGEGYVREELEEFIRKYGLTSMVTLAGYCDNIPEALASSDAFLLPSRREGLPFALMEAMAAGLPVITQPIRGCTDLVHPDKGGFLVTEEHFGSAIRSLMNSSEQCAKMGAWNKAAIQAFSIEHVQEQMNAIYTEVCREE
nr:glycosyltransferase family 4 protein [Eubacterium sp.]